MGKNITVIGTDSTHCVAFARLLHENTQSPWKISYAVRDSRSQLALSRERYQGIESQMIELGITIFTDLTPELVSSTDAFIIASVDASLHLSQFTKLVNLGKPIFIDKPISYSSAILSDMFALAKEAQLEIMSSSSLRFSQAVLQFKAQVAEFDQPPTTIKLTGPMPIEPGIPGMFWYGIHLVETLLTIYPRDFHVLEAKEEHGDLLIVCQSGDIRCEFYGDLSGHGGFGGEVVTREQDVRFKQESDCKPLYAYLVEAMLDYFETGRSPVSPTQTAAVISLVEKINDKGGWH